jgi:peptidoglycan/xylan/chitin deacetylase (PgdA/CDA1 family)
VTRSARFRLAVASVVAPLLVVAVIAVWASDHDEDAAGHRPTTSSTTSTSSTTTTTTTTTTTSTTVAPPTTDVPPPPPAPAPGRVISHGDESRRIVALTFDAGSDLGHTAQILDTLAANHIRATFGITGEFADRYPDTVRRIAAAGHQIVNHSYDHPSFTGRSTEAAPLPSAERRSQLQRAEAAIVAATGGTGTAGWFRPPYGDLDDGVVADVAAAGWPTVLVWSVDSLGWKGIGADAVLQRCLDGAAPGAIFLFHVGQASDDAAALQRVVDALRNAGYGFDSAAVVAR